MAKILPVSDLRMLMKCRVCCPILHPIIRGLDFGQPPPHRCVCCPILHPISIPRTRFWAATPTLPCFIAQYFIQLASRGLDFGQPPSLCRACRPKLQIVVFDLVKACYHFVCRIVFCDRYFPLQYIQVDECLQDEIERINEAIHRADGYGYNLHTVKS